MTESSQTPKRGRGQPRLSSAAEGEAPRFTMRLPIEQAQWVRAHGGAKRIRALIAAAMRQEDGR